MTFQENLAVGQIGEGAIARWLRRRGAHVLPAYEKEIDSGKGPRLFGPDGQLVTPDLFVFPYLQFIEAKSKSVFSWYHKTGEWLTGIDLNHYADYQKVERDTGRAVWLFFLHRLSKPSELDRKGRKDCRKCAASFGGSCCPPECPTGLFVGALARLSSNEHHQHSNHGRYGMVYWNVGALRRVAEIDEFDEVLADA